MSVTVDLELALWVMHGIKQCAPNLNLPFTHGVLSPDGMNRCTVIC